MRAGKYKLNKMVLAITLSCSISLGVFQQGFAQEEKNQDKTQSTNETTLHGRAVVIDVNSDKLEYFRDQNQFVATGSAIVVIESQNAKLEAKKIIYDQIKQELIAEEGVKITKNGKVINGTFARIDLTNKSALIDNPNTIIQQIKINATTANIYSDELEALKGHAIINNEDLQFRLSSTGFSPMPVSDPSSDTESRFTGKPKYKITTKEIIVDNKHDQKIITIKNANIWLGKIKIASIPSLELTADNETSRIETRLPEVGYIKELGFFAGPSHVFHLPKGSTLKASPIVTFGDGESSSVGGGGILRFASGTNKTDIAYSTLMGDVIINGEQNILSPKTKIIYGANTYVSDGILGYRKPKYIAEVVDHRKLASAMNFDLYLRSSAGYAEDYYTNFSTGRFRLQGDLISNKPILAIKNDLLQLGFRSQFNISVYGTGDTFGVLRAGPQLSSRLGPLSLSTTYFQAGIYGDTPFAFDQFVQGKSNLIFLGDVKLTKYLSIGHYRNLNLLKDNYQNKLTTENQIYARVGPEDIKVRIGYDTIRKRSTFGIDLLFGSGKTALDFDKLKVNQLDN